MDTEDASCLFLGGAEKPLYFEEGHRDEPERLLAGVQNDFERVVAFGADRSREVYNYAAGRTDVKGMKVTHTVINKDVMADVTGPSLDEFSGNSKATTLLQTTNVVRYENKSEARLAVQSFLSTSDTNYLILFMSGSGEQRKLKCKHGLIEESFMLPNAGGKALEYYTDSELTEDIKTYLPGSKRLYIVCNCVHSGGMLNTWELDAKEKEYVAMFASAEKDILQEPDDLRFIDKFCDYAGPGEGLMNIAGQIQDDFQDSSVRPSFIPLRPNFAFARFLMKGTVFDDESNESE